MQGQLLFLLENHFKHTSNKSWEEIPLPDELFVRDWEEYISDISQQGFFASLRKRLVQLNFPIGKEMSQNTNYQLATRSGIVTSSPEINKVELKEPDNIEVYLYQTLAGKIPVMQIRNRSDFETLVRVFAHKNEPVLIPPSMGACMIKGYNNWDRVNKYKEKWHSDNDYKENSDLLWKLEFEKMKSHKEFYRDTFLILSGNEYSNVPAVMLGLTSDEWQRLSLVIRREHEATHYCTLRFWGSARNDLLDELIADYMGLVAATGSFRAQWFLCFMGLEDYPSFRTGGRLANYIKNRELSAEAFEKLKLYINSAARNLEAFSNKYAPIIYHGEGKYQMLLAMSKMNLIELAAEDMEKKLLNKGLEAFLREEVH
ncbi:hypothetical protein JCM14036_29500 [Desulfotomaculum defluvii]